MELGLALLRAVAVGRTSCWWEETRIVLSDTYSERDKEQVGNLGKVSRKVVGRNRGKEYELEAFSTTHVRQREF